MELNPAGMERPRFHLQAHKMPETRSNSCGHKQDATLRQSEHIRAIFEGMSVRGELNTLQRRVQ